MESFRKVTGVAAPLNRANVDTDQIVPKQFLKRIERTGFGKFLFFDWRYVPGTETPSPDFILNKPAYAGAPILLAGRNFGCGSSREHAPWALKDYGFRVVIAPSYADIFYNNCFQNGLLPVTLTEEEVQKLMALAENEAVGQITVDLEALTVTDSHGGQYHFSIDAFRRKCLLEGLDDIGLTLQQSKYIDAYEAKRPAWVKGVPVFD